MTTVRLISRFGFGAKNVVAPLALLPIAFYLMKRRNAAFDTSSSAEDAEAQIAIRKWFVFSTLKNAFGGSSDTTLTRLRELLKTCGSSTPFPADSLYSSLGIPAKTHRPGNRPYFYLWLSGPVYEPRVVAFVP